MTIMKVLINKLLQIIFLILFLTSCGNKEEKKAKEILSQAKQKFELMEYNSTKILLDSIHQTFPRIISIRRQADTLLWQIQKYEFSRNLLYVDTMIVDKEEELKSMVKEFDFQKDSAYQDFGNYVHKTMTISRNAERCFLQPYANEKGEFFVLSQFFGNFSVMQKRIQVLANDLFVESNEGVFNAFYNENDVCESLILDEEALNDLHNFIVDNAQDRIKVRLLGNRSYIYYLENLDKDAFVKTQSLSVVLADLYRLRKEKETATLKLEKLNKKLQ